MNGLVEIRGTNHAFEQRNGVTIDFASAEERMRQLGCPEALLGRMRTRGLSKRSATPPRRTSRSLAEVQGTTDAALRRASDEALRSVARQQARKMDADLRQRSARLGVVISSDAAQEAAKAAQEKRDNDLRARMENAAGKTFGRRSKAVDDDVDDEDDVESDRSLASAVAKSFPSHHLVHADAKTAYTKDRKTGMKYSIPYSQNANGTHTFQQPQLGGHPAWLADAKVGFTAENGDL